MGVDLFWDAQHKRGLFAEERFRFVEDDDGHVYMIPADQIDQFEEWVEYETARWAPGMPEMPDPPVDFNKYRISDISSYTFTNPTKK